MSSRLDYAFPGGDESDYSDEEWDITVSKAKTRVNNVPNQLYFHVFVNS